MGLLACCSKARPPPGDALLREQLAAALSRAEAAEKKLAVLLKQGTQIVEVDMESGEPLSSQEDPGEEVLPQASVPPAPPSTPTKAKAKSKSAQPSLIGGLDDDDIPF